MCFNLHAMSGFERIITNLLNWFPIKSTYFIMHHNSLYKVKYIFVRIA